MGMYYDEIEIEDMAWDEGKRVYHYPCPCGDRFEVSRKQLANCEDIATCPSCSLIIRVVYDPLDYEDDEEEEDGESASDGDEESDETDDDSDSRHQKNSSDDGNDEENDDEFVDAMDKLHIEDGPKAGLVQV